MDPEDNGTENPTPSAENFSALKEQNEQLLGELKELKELFKSSFNSSPQGDEEVDEFAEECAKLFK